MGLYIDKVVEAKAKASYDLFVLDVHEKMDDQLKTTGKNTLVKKKKAIKTRDMYELTGF